jgi:propionate catabolism operon transcriptional regulator
VAARVRTRDDAARAIEPVGAPLRDHDWPGNVRELQNVVERMVVELADSDARQLTPAVLRSIAPELFEARRTPARPSRTLRERRRAADADDIRATLEACNGDRDRACELLGISRTTLWRRLNAAGADGRGERAGRRSAGVAKGAGKAEEAGEVREAGGD